MAGSNYSYESEFYSWLSDRIKPAQLSSVYEAFAQVNKFCLMRKVLTRPLFETDDINVLKAIQQTIDYNKIFRFTHRRYLSEMSAGIRQYIEYIKTHRKEETVPLDTTGKVLPPQEAKPVSMDPLISLILDAQIEFIDHRDKGGALWILGAENNKSFVNKCAQRGIVFRFKPEGSRATGGTAAWWTKYGTEKTPAKETDIKSSEPVNTDHSSEVLLPFRFNFQVQEQPVDANGEKIQPVSHNHDTEVVELLRDSIFDPLCEALAEEHVYTIEDLKKIRLWPFMNQHNLYTIATRQIVLTRVRELLSPVMQVEDGRLFRLHCGDAIYEGETASIAFLRYCENLAHRFPLKIRTLLGKNAPGSSLVALHQTNIQGNPLKMENPTAYIQEDLTSEDILLLAAWLGKACGCLSNDIKIEGQELSTMAPETLSQKQSDTAPPLQKLSAPARENKCSAMDQLMINKMESAVMQSDMTGLDFDELRDILRETMTETKRLVALAKHIVEIKGRLYHEDALIDWTEGADQLESIMDKLMQKNNGYISAAQLYEYAHADMNMFLNDNDINDVRSVYDIAQHLFEKNAYHGKRYAFTGKSHIATSSDVSTNFDVCCKYAEDQGGFFALSDLKEYLTSVGIKTGNLRAQLKLYDKPCFLYYEAGVLVLAKILQIDEKWLDMVRAALDKLFSDVGDHIILREIRPFWFEQLPALPNGRPWTPLMLQSVLRFYSEELGARTIIAMEYQSLETLHTMLVRSDSPIRNFGDVVISYIVENEIDQRSFEAEELRKILVESGIIQGNELIWNMAKALGNDERFAWNIDFTTEELASVYDGLKHLNCEATLTQFNKELDSQINKVSYARNKVILKETWHSISGKDSVKGWCKDYKVPLLWIVPKESQGAFRTLIDVQKNNYSHNTAVVSAINTLKSMDVAFLTNQQKVEEAFLKLIGPEFQKLWNEVREEVIAEAKQQIGNDMSDWNVADLTTLQKILKKKQQEKAKKEKLAGAKSAVRSMNENKLRDRVERFLDAHPEFCDDLTA